MSAEPRWIGKRALLLLHEESLAQFGGARGIRDEGPLDSALARARNTWAYRAGATTAELAAAYGYGLAMNRAFVAGNKRAAFLSIGLFLAANGHRLKAGKADAAITMLALAAGTLDECGLAAWIEANIEPAKISSL
jgi:death-on-curing protein